MTKDEIFDMIRNSDDPVAAARVATLLGICFTGAPHPQQNPDPEASNDNK